MTAEYDDLISDDRVVAQFLRKYHAVWQSQFPDLIKRGHWHTIFSARCSPAEGVACRALHRTLYGAYGTDIRTCVERIKECEREGFVRVVDAAAKPCTASASCFIQPTDKLYEHFDRHCAGTVAEVCSVFDRNAAPNAAEIECDDAAIPAIFRFFGDYDRKWRETSDFVIKSKGLTPAHADDAMNHLVTYHYWAIVLFLWMAAAERETDEPTALVVDEINSKMWDVLRLGHLAIRERVDNLIRWGFFAEGTIKKHKAVSLTPVASETMSRGLSETMPLLRDLHRRLAPELDAAQTARTTF